MSEHTTSTTRILRGWPLRLAQLAWWAVALSAVALVLIPLPDAYAAHSQQYPELTEWLRPLGGPGWLGFYFLSWQFLVVLSFGAVALLIAWRQPKDGFALVASATCLAFAAGLHNPAVALSVAPALRESLLANLASSFGLAFSVIFLFLFPSGRFVPRWTRWLALVWGLWMVGKIFIPSLNFLTYPRSAALGVQVVWYGSALASQVYRYRRVSTPRERQQAKWVVWGTAFALGGYVLAIGLVLSPFATPLQSQLAVAFIGMPLFYLPRALLAGAMGFSILRYRLWDVDFVINRSLVYGALAVLLAAFFGLSLALISWLFRGLAGGPLVAVAVAAAAFGAVFRPAHRALQRFVDRRFYNIHIDYQKSAPIAPEADASLAATNLRDYRNLHLIGRGGMAEVYRAKHPTLHQTVAIKLLPIAVNSTPELQQRFQREARIMRQLEHPNIVRILDYGQTADHHYIVMEYLGGPDLAHYLRQRGRLPLREVCTLLQPLADALDYAHAQGLVHRDIKPSNVMFASQDAVSRPVLMDFGIAKQLGRQTRLTAADGLVGTLDYIAPEQIQGMEDIDGRADVYALGVMVYEMLAGELPFEHQNPGALLIAHLTQPPPDARKLVPDLPESVAQALQRAMAKKAERRFATAGALADALCAAPP